MIDHLRQREADALIVSGSETDVCVLATVLDAVDIGNRVIVVQNAICRVATKMQPAMLSAQRAGSRMPWDRL
jgi:nicotinamidase-related amidase